MLILEKIHKNAYAAGSMTISSLSFKQKTMPKRPFILNIPLHLKYSLVCGTAATQTK